MSNNSLTRYRVYVTLDPGCCGLKGVSIHQAQEQQERFVGKGNPPQTSKSKCLGTCHTCRRNMSYVSSKHVICGTVNADWVQGLTRTVIINLIQVVINLIQVVINLIQVVVINLIQVVINVIQFKWLLLQFKWW